MREKRGLWLFSSSPQEAALVSMNGVPGGFVCTASGGLCWPDSQELLRSQRCVASLQLNREGSVLLPVELLLPQKDPCGSEKVSDPFRAD